jgi:hypothetical protein
MSAGMEVLVYECSWIGVACRWNRFEASHVLAQLCDELQWFNGVRCLSQELAGDSQWFAVHELS